MDIIECTKLLYLNFRDLSPTSTEEHPINVKKLKIANAVLFFFLVK